VSGQLRVPAVCLAKRSPGAYRRGRCVGPSAGLDFSEKRKSLIHAGNQASIPRSSLIISSDRDDGECSAGSINSRF
jgi:hypothetical protein